MGTSLSWAWSDKGHEGYDTDGHHAQVPRVLTNLLEKIQVLREYRPMFLTDVLAPRVLSSTSTTSS